MSREIPEPIRAAAGLAATVLDEARRLPSTLPGLPVRLVGLALQTAMKFQQQWSGLVARGDEVLTGLRGDREPGLATFDDDEDEAAAGTPLVAQPIDVLHNSAFDRAPDVDTVGDGLGDDAVVAEVEDTAAALDDADGRAGIAAAEVDVMEVDVDTDAAGLVDDELAGLPQDPSPASVVAAVEDVTDLVLGAEEAESALEAADSALTAEDALESALLEAEGTDAPAASDPGGSPVGELAGAPDVGSDDTTVPDAADSGVADTDIGLADDAGTGTAPDAGVLGEDAEAAAAPAEDAATEVDVITPDGQVTTVEGTVTDEGVVAPEDGGTDTGEGTTEGTTEGTATGAGSDVVTDEHARVDEETGAGSGPGEDSGAATDVVEPVPAADTTPDTTAEATDEGGTTVAAATGVRTDVGETGTAEEDAAIAEGAAVDAVGEQSAAPTDDPEGGSELSGSQAAGAAPIDGYDAFTIAQLRGRLRGYQLATVADLLAYEEATRARAPFLTMLRNRLEKLEQQAADTSPLQPRGQ
ncbi:hypothetical protein GCM10027451_02700 [Geodermatophilus aquaeductus]|uniref:Lipid droplet-associated protein n=1 Tax=Geodermatophilus aquaeductus TaxID=1564161 RepID=A0A521CHJ9_9ACTN|nr:hypothetical protein [Geodermatophilus aquaeductus]SMO58926.1 hypothetical protein SAMN06273567_102405 [Geodermatophilus aquaeductus]